MRLGFCLLFTSALFFSQPVFAQDPFFTNQSYGYSMVNPALTGSMGLIRSEMGYRLQWPNLAGNYQTMNVGGDMHTQYGNPGLHYMHDNAGSIIRTNRVDLNYACGIGLWHDSLDVPRIVVQPGVQISYFSKALDWDALTFGDGIDPRSGFVYNTLEVPNVTRRSNIDVSAGLLVMSKRISCGVAMFHITEPDEGFMGQSKLPFRAVFHGAGVLWNVNPDEPRAFRLVPSFIFMKQGDVQQLAFFGTGHYRNFSAGIGYRNWDALLFSAGYTYSHFTLAYSYDLTTSQLAGYTGGSHEVHLRFTILEDVFKYNATNMRMYY